MDKVIILENELSGVVPILCKDSTSIFDNINIQVNKLNTLFFSNNSKISYNSSCSTNITYKNIVGINNSRLYIEDYSNNKYSSKNKYNTIINFPIVKNSIDCNKQHVDLSGIQCILDDGIGNPISLSTLQWSRYLYNDGTVFNFVGDNNKTDNLIFPYRIKQFQIDINNNIQNSLDKLPKDLHQTKLRIYDYNNNNLIVTIKNFYNGIIEINNRPQTLLGKNRFIIENCETVIFNNYNNNNISETPIIFTKNVKHLQIENCEFSNQYNFNKKINQLNTLTYKTNICINAETYNQGIVCKLINTNAIIKNSSFNKSSSISYYSNILLYFIINQNSSIISNNNKFYYNRKTLNKRPIIFYIAGNSVVNAYNDKQVMLEDNKQQYSLPNSIDIAVDESFIYGYTLPGGIFNHNHSQYLLSGLYMKNRNKIDNDFPIGTIHALPNYDKYNFLTGGSATQHYNNQVIGYISFKDNTYMKLFLTSESTSSVYDALVKTKLSNDQFDPENDKLFPDSSYNYNDSKYAENLGYFQKNYSVNCHNNMIILPLSANFNNESIINILVSTIDYGNIYIYKNFFPSANIIIKYSQYTKYDKCSVVVNTSAKIRGKI